MPQTKFQAFIFSLIMVGVMACLMCPAMSFVATLLFNEINKNFIAIWLQTAALIFL